MTNKKMIIKDCKHINLTECGVYACKLYDPFTAAEAVVKGGVCSSNDDCPYKQLKRKDEALRKLGNIIDEHCNICRQCEYNQCSGCFKSYCIYNMLSNIIKEALSERGT